MAALITSSSRRVRHVFRIHSGPLCGDRLWFSEAGVDEIVQYHVPELSHSLQPMSFINMLKQISSPKISATNRWGRQTNVHHKP
ncbi:hypothetical protein BT69DRAFT_1278481 [Atractiella rhizophila]|nr:hypothetical protein BT69DRAFT_1278481 [Atractiella rhizophila]